MSKYVSLAISVLFFGLANPADAQQPPASTQQTIKRTLLNKVEVPGATYDVIYALVEIPANTTVGRHTHPGTLFAYLLGGDYTLLLDGQSGKTYKSGEGFRIEPLVIHDEKTGGAGAKLLAVFTVERGKPLSSPAN